MILNKDEYANKITSLMEIDEENKKIFISRNSLTIDKMYEEYKKNGGKKVDLSRCKDVDEITHLKIANSFEVKDASFASNWIVLPDLQKVLVKNILTDKYTKKERFYSLCNHLICPEISNKLGQESAEYYISQNKNGICLITPSFLQTGEKLISGHQINKMRITPGQISIERELDNLESFILCNHGSNEDIEESKRNYIKQAIFWYITENRDQADRNWGEIVSNNGCRYAPNFDYDFCFGKEDFGPGNYRVSDQNIGAAISKYKDQPWFIEWFKNKVVGLDIESVSKRVEECIPDKYKGSFEEYMGNAKDTIQKKISKVKDIVIPMDIDFN